MRRGKMDDESLTYFNALPLPLPLFLPDVILLVFISSPMYLDERLVPNDVNDSDNVTYD
jgi:hypothetical protein